MRGFMADRRRWVQKRVAFTSAKPVTDLREGHPVAVPLADRVNVGLKIDSCLLFIGTASK